MATANDFRRLALSLPNAIESSHMNHPDFRVLCPDNKLRIFCTLSGEALGRGVVNLTLEQQAAFCEELPQVFEPVQGGWGRMGMSYVYLEAVAEDTLLGALTTAHRNVLAKSMTKPAAKSVAKKTTRTKAKMKS
ncbi:hypothetical protein HDF16_003708 [Granulicella aggregans]|uniref:YjbR protein n=1 Tax=Granulicella aggregans TaxID=474949 RepID=A0A7W8E679_9BACT|nr:MmcQ/YjbR family DNA-binding protein [Granulicella aggregans]MBB5058985.1 hypothetical protein [Granulicella aggregans]